MYVLVPVCLSNKMQASLFATSAADATAVSYDVNCTTKNVTENVEDRLKSVMEQDVV